MLPYLEANLSFMTVPLEEYNDSRLDQLLIGLVARKMSRAVGKTTALSGYEGLVDLSEQVVKGYDAQGQQRVIGTMLRSLIPAPVLWSIRTFVRPARLILEWNAWFASHMFAWLVGPCEQREVEVPDAQGQPRMQRSGIHIKKCRYLEQSGCVGMCINMCKLPTQEFFAQEFGFPLTLTPNFEDLSCEMVFGQPAPPLQEEAIYHQPCLATQCSVAQPKAPACPKVREGAFTDS
ncbi:MAG: DUF4033 domain-containing protein [Cyanobacteria bacterium P01_A01_bin.17]